MVKLSAFADEVSYDFREQIDFLVSEKIKFIELRFVNHKNILDLSWEEVKEIKNIMDDNNISVSAIASPIGKVQLDKSFELHFDKFKYAVELSHFLGIHLLRIFSYYASEGEQITRFRDEVINRMIKKVDHVKNIDLVLVHENETNIYGATAERCRDIVETVNSPKLKLAYDPGNFVWGFNIKDNIGTCWPIMKDYVEHVHIKDWKLNEKYMGSIPGEGDAQIKELLVKLVDKKYSGFITLEPHLEVAGQFNGRTHPVLFSKAVNAVRNLCLSKDVNIKLD